MMLHISREEAKEVSDKRVTWDWIKYNVRLFSVDYSNVRKLIGRKRKGCKRNIKMHKLILKRTHLSKPEKALEECKMGLERFYDKV